jgi:hypothetical protein
MDRALVCDALVLSSQIGKSPVLRRMRAKGDQRSRRAVRPERIERDVGTGGARVG